MNKMMTAPQKTEKKSFFRSNPIMNRLTKVGETAQSKAAAYSGIMSKTVFFLLFTAAGMILYLYLRNTLFAGQADVISVDFDGFIVSTSKLELIVIAGVAILGIITQLISAFAPSAVPVTGSIYSVTQGFFISFMVFTVLKGYEYLGLLALVITMAIVLVMAALYTTGVIRATQKFKTVMLTLVFTMIAVSILTFIGSLIPLTRPFVTAIMGNFWVSIGLTVLSILIASLFLISDFAAIEEVVENRLPSKYEWSAAFALVFTVLWIYVKVLDLLIQIVGKNKD